MPAADPEPYSSSWYQFIGPDSGLSLSSTYRTVGCLVPCKGEIGWMNQSCSLLFSPVSRSTTRAIGPRLTLGPKFTGLFNSGWSLGASRDVDHRSVVRPTPCGWKISGVGFRNYRVAELSLLWTALGTFSWHLGASGLLFEGQAVEDSGGMMVALAMVRCVVWCGIVWFR